jgi:hypothetical protein
MQTADDWPTERSLGVKTELDHVFILCAPNAPEAAVLARHGFEEGSSNTHPGQGTASRRFFFGNAYLELLWVCDAAEASSDPVRRTRLWDRWVARHNAASPFGVVLRPAAEATVHHPPFAAWAYQPHYLPAGLAIHIALDTPLTEPELFYLGFQRDRARIGHEPTTHAVQVSEITSVSIGTPSPGDTTAARAEAMKWFSVSRADHHIMLLTFDSGTGGHSLDLRPDLPLVLRW